MASDPRIAAARQRLRPLPAAYQSLYDRLVSVVVQDVGVRALWLGGSVARGVADAGSDLDVLLAVDDDAFDGFAQNWRSWLTTVCPVLLAQELPGHPGSFFATTTDCLRLDVVVERVSGLPETPYRSRVTVIDRDGLTSAIPAPAPADGPDAPRIQALIEEFFRQQVIFPAAVVARADWLLGVVGVHNTQVMLYQLLVATNEPLPPMGVKQWSRRLTEEQQRLLAGLPSPQPCSDSIVSAMQAVRTAFRRQGRDAVLELGLPWPDAVDTAVARYWSNCSLESGAGADQ